MRLATADACSPVVARMAAPRVPAATDCRLARSLALSLLGELRPKWTLSWASRAEIAAFVCARSAACAAAIVSSRWLRRSSKFLLLAESRPLPVAGKMRRELRRLPKPKLSRRPPPLKRRPMLLLPRRGCMRS